MRKKEKAQSKKAASHSHTTCMKLGEFFYLLLAFQHWGFILDFSPKTSGF